VLVTQSDVLRRMADRQDPVLVKLYKVTGTIMGSKQYRYKNLRWFHQLSELKIKDIQ